MTDQSINGQVSNQTINLSLNNELGTIRLQSGTAALIAEATQLYFENQHLISIGVRPTETKITRTLTIFPASTIDAPYLTRLLTELALDSQVKLTQPVTTKLPANQRAVVLDYWHQIQPTLVLLGVSFVAPKKRPAKARHRWSKAIATIPFTTQFNGTQATVYWRKRNELVILAGAHMQPTAPLNADGTIGFSARFANQLREEHHAAIDDQFITTEEITLKSVNEVGLFLYFGGTNSWLQLQDPDGKTIHDWTVVQ